jgi:hypothetical protein
MNCPYKEMIKVIKGNSYDIYYVSPFSDYARLIDEESNQPYLPGFVEAYNEVIKEN